MDKPKEAIERTPLASVEGSSDEVVRELQRIAVANRRYGECQYAGTIDETAAHIIALRAELASVRAALKLANDSCRSAYQVAARRGIETNWDALQFSLQASLREQHKVMFPEQYTEDRRIRAHDSTAHPKDAP